MDSVPCCKHCTCTDDLWKGTWSPATLQVRSLRLREAAHVQASTPGQRHLGFAFIFSVCTLNPHSIVSNRKRLCRVTWFCKSKTRKYPMWKGDGVESLFWCVPK